jgi:hypothetical protein
VGEPVLSRSMGWPRSAALHRRCWKPHRPASARTRVCMRRSVCCSESTSCCWVVARARVLWVEPSLSMLATWATPALGEVCASPEREGSWYRRGTCESRSHVHAHMVPSPPTRRIAALAPPTTHVPAAAAGSGGRSAPPAAGRGGSAPSRAHCTAPAPRTHPSSGAQLANSRFPTAPCS